MTRKRLNLIIPIIISCLFNLSASYALDWKSLHDKADKTTLQEALLATQKNSGSIENLYLLGLVYLNLHKDIEAKLTFENILAKTPGIIEADWGRAEVLRRQHKLDESKELLRKVIGANPGFLPTYITLAYIRYTQLDFNESMRLASRVLKEGRDNVCLSNYVRALLLIGGTKGILAHYGGPVSKLVNGTRAFSYLKKARMLQPDSASVMLGLGSFYLLAPNIAGGDLEKAGVYLKRSIEIDPLFADTYVRLAQVYKAKGDNAGYLKYLEKALKIDPLNELAEDVKSGKCKFICR